ncbi:potassium channel protein, partial [Morganella morganii]|uniref:potassium channel protein n=1 Tax=Morganella morganii TaxID=582 RepID=UPI003EBF1428
SDIYERVSYWLAGIGFVLSGLSLYAWGFLIGVFISSLLGILTYRMNKREQQKRTRLLEMSLQHLINHPADERAKEAVAALAGASARSPKDL